MCSKDDLETAEQETSQTTNTPATPNPGAENIIRKGSLDSNKKAAAANKSAENIVKYTNKDEKK